MLMIDGTEYDGLTDEDRLFAATRWLMSQPESDFTLTAPLDFVNALYMVLNELELTEAERRSCIRRAARLLSIFAEEPKQVTYTGLMGLKFKDPTSESEPRQAA